MKSGRTLTDLAAEIERRASAKRDVVASTSAMGMRTFERHEGASRDLSLKVGKDIEVPVGDIAHGQIASHTEIPQKYYDKMRREAPDLLCTNVGRWFQEHPAPRMVRMLDGRARSFHSDRYRPLENEDLAQAVLPVLGDLGADIMSAQITERKLYIKVVDSRVTREIKARGGAMGDGHTIVRCLAPALTISNSEVGLGSLSVMAGVYDSFCSNLATFGERSVRKYHVGTQHDLGMEQVLELLSDETRRLTDAAVWSQVRDVVKGAFERARFDSLCDKIEGTTTQRIEGDPVMAVQLSARKLGLTSDEGTSVLRHLIEGGDLSRFGLHCAVTRAAADIESYDRATELERIGAEVIELPQAEWRELALAA